MLRFPPILARRRASNLGLFGHAFRFFRQASHASNFLSAFWREDFRTLLSASCAKDFPHIQLQLADLPT